MAVDSLPNLTTSQIAGRYTNPSAELVKRTGPPLAGENLYIFTDNSYVYCKWADIMPDTIFDKSTWTFGGDVLELKSDADIAWKQELERRFLVVRRPTHKDEILLVGMKNAVEYFAKHAGEDPELMLLIVSLPREASIAAATTTSVKAKLIRQAWHPEFFSKQ